MRIAVCVITFRHLPGLARLLASIAGLCFQKIAPEVTVRIVDNDPQGGAREQVEKLVPTFPFKLVYEIETQRGISAARNRAVKAATHADFLAFVDDDEQVGPDWLEQLVGKLMESAADIVMGPVRPEFEKPVPDWIVQGGFFVKDLGKYGARDQKYGSTANILIRRACLDNLGEPFADQFNLTGGADYLLLLRLKIMGAKIDWAPAARVVEYIPAARANGCWILKRRFRTGNSIALAERSLKLPSMMARPGKGVLRILQGVLLLPFSLLRGTAETVRTLGMIYYGCGNLSGFFGCPYRAYGPGKNDHD